MGLQENHKAKGSHNTKRLKRRTDQELFWEKVSPRERNACEPVHFYNKTSQKKWQKHGTFARGVGPLKKPVAGGGPPCNNHHFRDRGAESSEGTPRNDLEPQHPKRGRIILEKKKGGELEQKKRKRLFWPNSKNRGWGGGEATGG